MQRAERHERLMRAKINRVLAELRGAQPQKGPRQQGIARAQEQNGLSLGEAGPLSEGGKSLSAEESIDTRCHSKFCMAGPTLLLLLWMPGRRR